MMGAAAQTLFDFEFGLSSYMRLEINMPLFAARRTVLSAAAAHRLIRLKNRRLWSGWSSLTRPLKARMSRAIRPV